MRGPDGTLNGDARALGVAGNAPVEKMKRFLAGFQDSNDLQARRALAVTAWPLVRRLLDHHLAVDLSATAREDARPTLRAQRVYARVARALAKAIKDCRDLYRNDDLYRDDVVARLIQARRAIGDPPGPVSPPWSPVPAARGDKSGNPLTRMAADARVALAGFLDEDQQTEFLRLIGLLPLQ